MGTPTSDQFHREVEGKLSIPMELIPPSLIRRLMDPKQSIPLLKISLPVMFLEDGFCIETTSLEGMFLKFDFAARDIEVETL